MKKNNLLIALVILLLGYSACRKPGANRDQLTKSQFPVAVNDKWVYLLLSEFTTDTVTISVVSKTTYSNDSVVYYTRSYIDGIVRDSGYIISGPNSFTFSMDTNPINLFTNLHLTFPMTVGVAVTGQNNTDILTLDTFGLSESSFGHTYNNVYIVSRNETSPWTIQQTVEIQPNIGIVEGNFWQSIPGFLYWDQSVYLLSYELH